MINGDGAYLLLLGSGSFLGILTIAGFSIKTYRETSSKRARIYERIDEEKKKSDDKYVARPMCELTHRFTNETLVRIEKKIDTLVDNGKPK